jgi:hypothetical protein
VDSPTADPRRRVSGELLLFAALLAAHLLPIWVFPFFPSQDGPGHLALANILRQIDEPDGAVLREYYVHNPGAVPNWFIFAVMSRVLGFLPVPLTEKVVLSAYVLLLPISVRYALRGIAPGAAFLSVLAFPFVYNFALHMGFYNFCISLIGFFFTVGYWWRHRERMGWRSGAVLAALAVATYFCHPVSFVLAFAAILTLAGWRTLLDWKERRPLLPAVRQWVLGPVTAFLPGVVLLLTFLGSRMDSRILAVPLEIKIRHLLFLFGLTSLDPRTTVLALAVAILFAVAALRCLAQRRQILGGGLLLVVAMFLAAYFLAPDSLGGGSLLTPRLNLFPFLGAILWLGTFAWTPRWRRGIQIAAAGIALGFLGVFGQAYARFNDLLAEYLSVLEHVEPDSTLLTLSYAHWGETAEGEMLSFRGAPFLHASGHIAARKRVADLALYEANEDHFPLLYRPDRNPYRHMGAIEGLPPAVDFLTYPQRTGGRVDYVLLWGLSERWRGHPAVGAVVGQLQAAYEPVYTSERGLVRLFRRQGESEKASPAAPSSRN